MISERGEEKRGVEGPQQNQTESAERQKEVRQFCEELMHNPVMRKTAVSSTSRECTSRAVVLRRRSATGPRNVKDRDSQGGAGKRFRPLSLSRESAGT